MVGTFFRDDDKGPGTTVFSNTHLATLAATAMDLGIVEDGCLVVRNGRIAILGN